MPHALLLSGPRGIGKATLGYRFARFVLAHGAGQGAAPGLFADEDIGLTIPPESGTYRRVASGGHADLLTVERLCDRAIFLQHGRVVLDGPVASVVSAYRRSLAGGSAHENAAIAERPVTVTRVAAGGKTIGEPARTGHPLNVRVSYAARETIEGAEVQVWYCTHGGHMVHC